jgi:hypothetical protein
VPSHYNRINSNRTYLPAHLNQHILYEDCKKAMLEEGKEIISSLKYSRKYLMSLTQDFINQNTMK